MSDSMVEVEVAYALPHRQKIIRLQVRTDNLISSDTFV